MEQEKKYVSEYKIKYNKIHKEKHRWAVQWEIMCDGQPIACVTQFVYWVHALFCSPKRNVREWKKKKNNRRKKSYNEPVRMRAN